MWNEDVQCELGCVENCKEMFIEVCGQASDETVETGWFFSLRKRKREGEEVLWMHMSVLEDEKVSSVAEMKSGWKSKEMCVECKWFRNGCLKWVKCSIISVAVECELCVKIIGIEIRCKRHWRKQLFFPRRRWQNGGEWLWHLACVWWRKNNCFVFDKSLLFCRRKCFVMKREETSV